MNSSADINVQTRRVPARSAAVTAALIFTAFVTTTARADSFFDIYVDLWDSGHVVMSPIDSAGAFPFPPPPLDFPDLPAAQRTIDIELVSLSLQSSQPMVVSPPDPTGRFTVDSFFDIEYRINIVDGSAPPQPVIDSFFDIVYRMDVTPDRNGTLPDGSELRTFDIEIVSMGLSSPQPISLPGGGEFDLAIQLVEGFSAGVDGHVTVLKLAGGGGGGGGAFQVDSFFDIFVELSIDGGPPVASTQDSQLRLAGSNVVLPTPTAFGMVAALGAVICTRRRLRHC